jgi:hypothetical protein
LDGLFQHTLGLAIKQTLSIKPSTNPSWKNPGARVEIDAHSLGELFQLSQNVLAQNQAGLKADIPTEVVLGDSRDLFLSTGSVDAVITSPPYCTRLDYARAMAFELALHGPARGVPDEQSASQLRRSMMGTTMIRRQRSAFLESSTTLEVSELIRQVEQHPSYASARYYGPWFRQYCEDADISLSEIARVLRVDGRCVIVVQDSYYKDVHIPLDRIFAALAVRHGLAVEWCSSWSASHVLALSNPRTRAYASKGRVYLEHALCLKKTTDGDTKSTWH